MQMSQAIPRTAPRADPFVGGSSFEPADPGRFSVNRGQRQTQLDGLRGLAAIAVVIRHFPPADLDFIDLGRLGVWLFFVLSGFLITGILLRARAEAEITLQGRNAILVAFYVRRFLRIFPLYYAVLIGSAIVDERVRKVFPWFFFYLSNVYISCVGELNLPMNHFWSLAVEEHFYVLWPALVLFVPKRSLMPVMAVVVAAGPVSRFLLLQTTGSEIALSYFTTSCLDPLGMGGMLALWHSHRDSPPKQVRFAWALLAAGIGLVALCHGFGEVWGKDALRHTLEPLSWSLIGTWLVGRAADGFVGPGRSVLEAPAITYIGTISYGLYVYHPLIPRLAEMILRPFGFEYASDVAGPGPLSFVSVLLASTVIATVSWYTFEKPISELKRFFPYIRRPSYGAVRGVAVVAYGSSSRDTDPSSSPKP
jgi:peptidoglycan/LPS O-acetylase OafA/YrhL